MRIHFSWTSDASEKMTKNSFYLATTARELGPCTIWTLTENYDKFDPVLKKLCDVRPFDPQPGLEFPWSCTPKYRVEPEGDILLACGADTIIWSPERLILAAKEALAHNAITGTIAYLEPMPETDWEQLFTDYELEFEPCHKYQMPPRNPAPFYLNSSAVLCPPDALRAFRPLFYGYLKEIYDRYPKNYFWCQVALCLAIYKSGVNRLEMTRLFNYSELCHPGMPDIDSATIVHCEVARDNPEGCGIPALAKKFKELNEAIRVARCLF